MKTLDYVVSFLFLYLYVLKNKNKLVDRYRPLDVSVLKLKDKKIIIKKEDT